MAMKLYVWEDVLCDYTCGLAFAIAPDLASAIKAAANGDSWVESQLRGEKPKVYKVDGRKTPIGRYIYGGG